MWVAVAGFCVVWLVVQVPLLGALGVGNWLLVVS